MSCQRKLDDLLAAHQRFITSAIPGGLPGNYREKAWAKLVKAPYTKAKSNFLKACVRK